jgi:hypothetical protein
MDKSVLNLDNTEHYIRLRIITIFTQIRKE